MITLEMVNSDYRSDDADDTCNVDENDDNYNNEIMGLRDPQLGLRDLHIEAFTMISSHCYATTLQCHLLLEPFIMTSSHYYATTLV